MLAVEPQSFLKWRSLRLPILITLSAAIWLTILTNLHGSWTPLPWLVGTAVWAYYFWSDRIEPDLSVPESRPFAYGQFLFVLAAATVLRFYNIRELPLGSYVDEVLTLTNSLGLLDRPFDLFGQTPLLWSGWVKTANLYLYFDLLILKLFGVSYWSMKLLSVIPGIIACGAVFLISQLLFDRRVALWTALLFTFAHWPVRLSRYGWDVSFMVMGFATSILAAAARHAAWPPTLRLFVGNDRWSLSLQLSGIPHLPDFLARFLGLGVCAQARPVDHQARDCLCNRGSNRSISTSLLLLLQARRFLGKNLGAERFQQ